MLTVATRKIGGQIQVLEALALRGQPEGEAFCPSTDCMLALEPVSAFQRVGNIAVRAFFRHKRGSAGKRPCWGAKGEGGLHFAAKLLLRARLQELCASAGVLVVEQPCLRCAVGISHEALRFEPGDTVTIEHWLDPRRTLKPDVVVSRGSVPLLSFEVRAAHPCSPRKIGALTTAGAQMVEVEARSLLGTETIPAWHSGAPLPLKQAVLPINRQLCGSCQTAQDREAACAREREEQRQREREEQQRRDAQRAREYQEQHEREMRRLRERAAQWTRERQEQHEREVRRERENQTERARNPGGQQLVSPLLRSPALVAPKIEVIAHCYLDLCRSAGVREELELVLERVAGNVPHAQLKERRKLRLLKHWKGKEVEDTEWLLRQAREAASEAYKPERESGCTVDPYGGFRLGPMVKQWPDPNYWWEEKGQRWVKARLRHLLAAEMKMSEDLVEARLPPEQFRRIQVRFKATKPDFPAYEPVGLVTFEPWLRAGQP